jgi:hypothetical protein
MADNDAVIAELKALTGQLQRNERATTALSAAQTANAGAPSYSGSSGGGGSAPAFGAPGAAPSPPRFSNYSDRQQFTKILSAGFGALAGAAGAISMALPTTQEAVDVQLLADRMKFFGGAGSRSGAMTSQLRASLMGTATSPEDSALASNYAAQRGLMPGLKNFGAGAGYTGIMGGAALASNLTPGLGISGGVGVMAGLNDPKIINMARMFGIQMRNKEGTGMIDLPKIIKQLYDILSKAGPVTKENIAISAMPGNALDSILNQYFGLDPNVRSTVLSGLTQLATSNGNINSFSKSSLIASGASTAGVQSTGNRAAGELKLLQNFSGNTVNNLIGANNILNKLYGGMVGATGKSADLIRYVGNVGTTLETIGGARGGAGQLLVDSLFDASGALLGLKGPSKLFGLGVLGAAGKKGFDAFKNGFGSGTPADPYFTGGGFGQYDSVTPSNPGQMFTGAITINVSGGVDQYNIASAISDALSRAM